MKDLSVFSSKISFFFIISLKKMRYNVCSSICFALTIIYPKIITRKLLSPADLARTQALCIYESSKVIVVSKKKNLVFTTFWIMLPCFKGLNNGQKLTVRSFIWSLGRKHFTQSVAHRMPLAWVISQLTQHSTNCMPRCVSFNPDVSFQIKGLNNKRFSKGLT